MESNIGEGDFPLSDDMPASWLPTADSSMTTNTPLDSYANNWEDFMRWDSSQAQTSRPLNSHVEPYSQSTNMPFMFGQPTANAPPFDINCIASDQISPVSDVSYQSASDTKVWGERPSYESADSGLISPFLVNGQVPNSGLSESLSTPSLQHTPGSQTSGTGASKSPQSSPEPAMTTNPRKRKSSSEGDAEDEKGGNGKVPVKKTAHNMIEKRYRTNLNDKIAALRNSVPSLRQMSRINAKPGDEDDPEDLDGLAPAHKLNKATVLSKATEYIQHLEKRNKRMADENAALKARNQALEKMQITAPMANPSASAVSTPDAHRFQDDIFSRTPGGPLANQHPPQGMIPVPENIANLRLVQQSAPYSVGPQHGYSAYPNGQVRTSGVVGQPTMVRGGNGRILSRLMVGSLAGLMLLEGLAEHDRSGNDVEARGLFALPVAPLGRLGRLLGPPMSSIGISNQGALLLLKLLLILSAFCYVLAPLLDFRPRSKKNLQAIRLSPAPSLASPVELRHKAWLTAIQSVWVPRHSFLLEIAALGLKTVKLSARKLIGWRAYAALTSSTKEQETVRVRAWEIALEAQLTGGDVEISMSRLILTLLASGTLSNTPTRLMLKALHIHIVFREVTRSGYGTWGILDEISFILARSCWNAARNEHKMQVNSGATRAIDDSSTLPDHLSAILDLDADDVLVDSVVQRSYNLAWNRPSAENTEGEESMDNVAEDFGIASPLDALAAWWSTLVVNRVLVHSLDTPDEETRQILANDLQLAIRTAPPNSFAQIRALAVQAVLEPKNREANISLAVDALPRQSSSCNMSSRSSSPCPLINIMNENPVPPDVCIALTLAKCLALSENLEYESQLRATSAVNNLQLHQPLTLLSFTASLLVLERFTADKSLLGDARAGP